MELSYEDNLQINTVPPQGGRHPSELFEQLRQKYIDNPAALREIDALDPDSLYAKATRHQATLLKSGEHEEADEHYLQMKIDFPDFFSPAE